MTKRKDYSGSLSTEELKEILEQQWKKEGTSNSFRKCKWLICKFKIDGKSILEDISKKRKIKFIDFIDRLLGPP